ncbi:GerAB/ArcD/ProY family transporter [Paenibacillus wynnii]|uniref:Spore gernimation protein n=1 Tax=Paenibacillus wynnii TaxID=268407 RepID=A0A098M7V0_9BACL|nr:GerAB/ArcD/ProY family transporter [Paenibacillus wynnii]KGE18659.1 spore gernimation protein [Paenibacillus wynnii]
MSLGKIRVSELVVVLSIFEVGSTTLFLMGAEAKQDAWLAMLIGATAGFLLLLLHLSIHRRDPQLDLFRLFRRYMGKYLGTFINILFVGYFTYEASRNLRDFGELTIMSLLNRTSLWIIILIVVLIIANLVRYGPEVFFMFCMILFPVMLIGYLVISVLIPATGLFHFEYMLPVLEFGLMPAVTSAIPEIVSFPFGQTVLFLVFYPLAMKGRNLPRAVIVTYIISALFLTVFNQLNIFVLGTELAPNMTLPLLETVQLIQLTQVFERTDALFTMVLYIGLGTKMAAFYLGAVIGLERITKISYKKWVLPLAILLYYLAFLSPNYTHHIEIGRGIAVNRWWPIFQIILPILLFLVMVIRRRKKA